LTWRDVKVRYRQAAIGVAWAVIQPLATMVVLTIIFSHFGRFPSGGMPYPIFSFAALLAWNFFANGLGRAAVSVANSAPVISKIYFPRLLVPFAAASAMIVDLVIAFVVLLGMMFWFGIKLTPAMGTLPLFVLLDLLVVLGFGFWLSALNVKYRDVSHAIPLLLQLWMFASPVVYPLSVIPAKWQLLYNLNPMVGVVQGFRWALLGKEVPQLAFLTLNVAVALVVLSSGLVYFKRTEQTFADVI
jgi:lipopolysaccharide transport system permease protein